MKLKLQLLYLLERLGMWCLNHCGKSPEDIGYQLLRESGAKVCLLSSRITPYLDEITQLCLAESRLTLVCDDVLGSGYFRARRVMTKLKIAHPELRIRDLWKAVDYCSGLISSGQKQTQAPSRLSV